MLRFLMLYVHITLHTLYLYRKQDGKRQFYEPNTSQGVRFNRQSVSTPYARGNSRSRDRKNKQYANSALILLDAIGYRI